MQHDGTWLLADPVETTTRYGGELSHWADETGLGESPLLRYTPLYSALGISQLQLISSVINRQEETFPGLYSC